MFATRTYTHLSNSHTCNRLHPSCTLYLVTPIIAVLVNFTSILKNAWPTKWASARTKTTHETKAACAETCYPISNICYMVNIRFFKLSGRVFHGFFYRAAAIRNHVSHPEWGGSRFLWNVKTSLLSYMLNKITRLSSYITCMAVRGNLLFQY